VRTDDELREIINPSIYQFLTPSEEPFWVKAKRVLTEGVMFDSRKWAEKTKVATLGDTTFMEAYQRTGRILNITTSSFSKHHPHSVLNYITSPNVAIWSAVLASASMPGVLKPPELVEKRDDGTLKPYHYRGLRHGDGSLRTDLPIDELSQMSNTTFFIVSQVNPAVTPFFFGSRGSPGNPSPRKKGTSGMRGGFLATTLEMLVKFDMVKWLKLLADLDLLPTISGQDMRYVFLQKAVGDVTIVPSLTLGDYWRVVSDPSISDMQSYLLRGQRATWPCLAHIESFMRLEQMINKWSKMLNPEQSETESKAQPPEVSFDPASVPGTSGVLANQLAKSIMTEERAKVDRTRSSPSS